LESLGLDKSQTKKLHIDRKRNLAVARLFLFLKDVDRKIGILAVISIE